MLKPRCPSTFESHVFHVTFLERGLLMVGTGGGAALVVLMCALACSVKVQPGNPNIPLSSNTLNFSCNVIACADLMSSLACALRADRDFFAFALTRADSFAHSGAAWSAAIR